jgi:hypothetical protein
MVSPYGYTIIYTVFEENSIAGMGIIGGVV